jgi:hypothetical protein
MKQEHSDSWSLSYVLLLRILDQYREPFPETQEGRSSGAFFFFALLGKAVASEKMDA